MSKRGSPDLTGQVGTSVVRLWQAIERWADEEVYITQINISTPYKGQSDYLAVVKVNAGGKKSVGFHSADSLWELLMGLSGRIQNKSLVLREDQYG